MERPLLAALVSGKLGEWLKLVCLQWEVEWNDLHCLFDVDSVVDLFSTNLKTVKCHAARITATELTCVHFASPSGLVLGLSTVNQARVRVNVALYWPKKPQNSGNLQAQSCSEHTGIVRRPVTNTSPAACRATIPGMLSDN